MGRGRFRAKLPSIPIEELSFQRCAHDVPFAVAFLVVFRTFAVAEIDIQVAGKGFAPAKFRIYGLVRIAALIFVVVVFVVDADLRAIDDDIEIVLFQLSFEFFPF